MVKNQLDPDSSTHLHHITTLTTYNTYSGHRVKVKVKVTLRLMVSQSVSLGVEPHLDLMTRYLLLFDSYGLVLCGAPSLTRGWAYLGIIYVAHKIHIL
jgi:hypothetical protein